MFADMVIALLKGAIVFASIVYWLIVLWVVFVAIMNIMRVREHLTLPAKLVAYPVGAVGYVFDIVANVVVGSLIFFELPDKPTIDGHKMFVIMGHHFNIGIPNFEPITFSGRCSKHCGKESWRGTQARWWCDNFLDPFDPSGKHCKCKYK